MQTEVLIPLPSRWWRIEHHLSVDTPFAYPCFQFPFVLCKKEPSPRSGFIEYNHKMQKKRYAKKIEAVSV